MKTERAWGRGVEGLPDNQRSLPGLNPHNKSPICHTINPWFIVWQIGTSSREKAEGLCSICSDWTTTSVCEWVSECELSSEMQQRFSAIVISRKAELSSSAEASGAASSSLTHGDAGVAVAKITDPSAWLWSLRWARICAAQRRVCLVYFCQMKPRV